MAYQYTFCPTCGTRRVAYDYRCSVCDGLVRRTPPRSNLARTVLSLPSTHQVEAVPAERPRVAA